MAHATYSTPAVVLKKTKLGENDLIITLLAANGAQIRCVAKGARKPSSSFASRLELYSEAELLLAPGKSLDIVKEVKLVAPNDNIRCSVELNAVASVYAELLTKLTEQGFDNERLYEMSVALFAAVSASTPSSALSLSCAACIKAFAFSGIGPYFTQCVACGNALTNAHASVPFSVEEGGYICSACASFSETVQVEPGDLMTMQALLKSTFADICKSNYEVARVLSCFQLVQMWCRYHLGFSLKSLNFLMSAGLF